MTALNKIYKAFLKSYLVYLAHIILGSDNTKKTKEIKNNFVYSDIQPQLYLDKRKYSTREISKYYRITKS